MAADLECAVCHTANPAAAKFCMACGGSLTRTATTTNMRFVTVAFCDISGSTELALRFDPQVWHSILEAYFATVGGALAEAGGRMEKFIGDAVVGVFGADSPGEDDAYRAVQGALHAFDRLASRNQDTIERHGVTLSVRFGVASGRVVTAERDSSFAIGSVMNRAARLQSAAPPDGVVVDVRTWLLVRDRLRCDPIPPVPAKGFDRPLQAWAVTPEPTRAPARADLVNQADLTTRLRTEVRRALSARSVTTIALHGEVGSGKSRILNDLAETMRSGGARVLRLDSGRGDGNQSVWLLQQVDRALGASPTGSVGTPSTQELQWSIRRRLTQLSNERPLLITMDDYPLAPDAIRALVRFPPGTTGPIAVVVTGRDPVPACDVSLSIPLLSQPDARVLLGTLVGDLEMHAVGSAAIADAVVERSRGNPLFLEQLAAMAVDGISDELPPSAEAALGARIGKLGPPARHVLACLGAWERDVSASDLAAVCDLDEQALAAGLSDLEDAGLAGSKTAAEVAYAHLVLSERARIHTAIAHRLQEYAATEPALLDLAKAHALRGGGYWHELEPGGPQDQEASRLAAHCLVAAGRLAIARSEFGPAAAACAQARELAVPGNALALEIAALETYALGANGQVAEALDRLAAASSLSGNQSALAHLKVNETLLTGVLSEETRTLVESVPDASARARLNLWHGIQKARAGDYPAAEERLRLAHSQVRHTRTCLQISNIYATLSLVLVYSDTPVPQALEQCLELRREVADAPILHATVSCATALLTCLDGDHEQALRLLGTARAVFAEMGHLRGEASAYEFSGEVAEIAGDLPAASQAMLHARSLYLEAGAESAAALCAARAYVLDPSGDPPDTAALDLRESWVARTLAHQAAALAAPGTDSAADHLVQALEQVETIRGAGATLAALSSCLRTATVAGNSVLVERIGSLIADAAARRSPA